MAKGQRLVWNNELKRFVPGEAKPWLPPEHMRALPGDLVTKDTSDPDKVHELDAPHIVENLKDEWEIRQGIRPDPAAQPEGLLPDPAKQKKYRVAQPGENVPLNQEQIDFVRLRVLKSRIDSALTVVSMGGAPDLSVHHLWFPTNNVNVYSLKSGPGPRDKERPKHLRGFELEVDIFNWPRRIRGILEEGGHEVPDPKALWKKLVEEATLRRTLEMSAMQPWQ